MHRAGVVDQVIGTKMSVLRERFEGAAERKGEVTDGGLSYLCVS